jgi:hypothetical protein
MYDLVDRPITILSDGSRFLLWAMRAWVAVQGKGECPPAKLAAAFLKMSAIEALPHFHIAMSTLDQAGRETIHLHCPHRGQIGDDEAILLRLWSDMAAGDECAAIAVIEMLVQADAAAGYFSAVRAALPGLEAAGLSPVIMARSGRELPALLNAPRWCGRRGHRRTGR